MFNLPTYRITPSAHPVKCPPQCPVFPYMEPHPVNQLSLLLEGGVFQGPGPRSFYLCPQGPSSIVGTLELMPTTGLGFFFFLLTGFALMEHISLLNLEQWPQLPHEKWYSWVAPVVQLFSAACSPGPDPGVPGLSPKSGSLHGACFSLCLCLSFSVYVSLLLINR